MVSESLIEPSVSKSVPIKEWNKVDIDSVGLDVVPEYVKAN